MCIRSGSCGLSGYGAGMKSRIVQIVRWSRPQPQHADRICSAHGRRSCSRDLVADVFLRDAGSPRIHWTVCQQWLDHEPRRGRVRGCAACLRPGAAVGREGLSGWLVSLAGELSSSVGGSRDGSAAGRGVHGSARMERQDRSADGPFICRPQAVRVEALRVAPALACGRRWGYAMSGSADSVGGPVSRWG